MYSTKVSYEDFNGDKKEETLYFFMNKPEIIRFLKNRPQFTDEMEAMADRLAQKTPDSALYVDFMTLIDELVTMSYGEKTLDGKFRKNSTILEDFMSSNAYDALFSKFMENPKEFDAFTEGIFPADVMTEEVRAEARGKIEALKEKIEAE